MPNVVSAATRLLDRFLWLHEATVGLSIAAMIVAIGGALFGVIKLFFMLADALFG